MTEASTYREPARSYASLWILVAVLGVGFVVDLALGGGVAHLLGWALALVIVVGLNWIVVYAVRSQKSLLLTADELRIGDEAIGRGEIVAVASGVDDELPVLGWPTGKPRGLKGLTVRLFDGQDVVVPSRFPDRLEAALGVAGRVDLGPQVRAAARSEFPELVDLDRRAETVFRLAGYDLPDLPGAVAEFGGAKAVFVAGRPPVGFVRLGEVDGVAHLEEIAVLPRWMKQGIGSRLLERACEWASSRGYAAVVLTTYADVAWNAPFYARRGFVEVPEPGPGLAAVRERERVLGLDEVGRRIVMRRELSAPREG